MTDGVTPPASPCVSDSQPSPFLHKQPPILPPYSQKGRPNMFARDAERNQVYVLGRKLGSGTSGAVFEARLLGSGVDGPPTHVVKRFERHTHSINEPENEFKHSVQTEYYSNRLARHWAGAESAAQMYACAERCFFETAPVLHGDDVELDEAVRGYIVYPYHANTYTLLSFQYDVLYEMHRGEGRALRYWCLALDIAARLCDAVGTLNAHGIYHRDIKTVNIIVTVADDYVERLRLAMARDDSFGVDDSCSDHPVCEPISVRLVDFGLAMATPAAAGAFLAKHGLAPTFLSDLYDDTKYVETPGGGRMLRKVSVAHYTTTCISRDPRTMRPAQSDGEAADPLLEHEPLHYDETDGEVCFSADQASRFFGHFETFAVATVVQTLFDPQQNRAPWPTGALAIRRTESMPPPDAAPLLETLREMTGPLAHRKPVHHYAAAFRAMRAELLLRARDSAPVAVSTPVTVGAADADGARSRAPPPRQSKRAKLYCDEQMPPASNARRAAAEAAVTAAAFAEGTPPVEMRTDV